MKYSMYFPGVAVILIFTLFSIVSHGICAESSPSSNDPVFKRKHAVLGLIWQDIQREEVGSAKRKEHLTEFMTKSGEYLAALPEGDGTAGQIWTFRAVVAVDLGLEQEAKAAGVKIQLLGLEENPVAAKILAVLERKGWLMDPRVFQAEAEAEAIRHATRKKAEEEWVSLKKQFGGENGAIAIPGLGLTMIPVAPNTFFMGARDADIIPLKTDGIRGTPRMAVRLTQGYWLGKTEVTQGQWTAIMGTTLIDIYVRKFPTAKRTDLVKKYFGETGDDPMIAIHNVSWDEAIEFCAKLTAREAAANRIPKGYAYTLPTEAQWEMACRAGTETAYHFGDSLDNSSDYCAPVMLTWVTKSKNAFLVNRVQTKKANPWGFHDMEGNVWEWCLDYAADSYPRYTAMKEGFVENPVNNDKTGQVRVTRGGAMGGAFAGGRRGCAQSNARLFGYGNNQGFRVALSPTGGQEAR